MALVRLNMAFVCLLISEGFIWVTSKTPPPGRARPKGATSFVAIGQRDEARDDPLPV